MHALGRRVMAPVIVRKPSTGNAASSPVLQAQRGVAICQGHTACMDASPQGTQVHRVSRTGLHQ